MLHDDCVTEVVSYASEPLFPAVPPAVRGGTKASESGIVLPSEKRGLRFHSS